MKVGINQRFECFDTIRMYERPVVHGIQKDTTNKDRLTRTRGEWKMKCCTDKMTELVSTYKSKKINADQFNLNATKILLHSLILNGEYDLVAAYMEVMENE